MFLSNRAMIRFFPFKPTSQGILLGFAMLALVNSAWGDDPLAPVTIGPGSNGGIASTPVSTQALSLSEAFELAKANNPTLQAAEKNKELSNIAVKISHEFSNPSVQGYVSNGTVTNQLGNPQMVVLSKNFATAGKYSKRIRIAEAQQRVTMSNLSALEWDIRNQVRQAYADLAGAEENIELINNLTRLSQSLVDIATKRYQAGAVPQSEVFQAQLSRSQMDSLRLQAESQLRNTQNRFNTLLGNTLQSDTDAGYQIIDKGYFRVTVHKTEVVPPPDSTLPALGDLTARAENHRSDLQAALQQVDLNQKQLGLVKANRIPDLQLSGGYLFMHLPSVYSPTHTGKTFTGLYMQTGFELPIFHNQGREIQQARVTIEQANLQVNAVRKQVASEVRTAYIDVQAAKDRIQLYQSKLLPDSANVLRLAQRSYEVGKTPLSNVILAQQSDQQIWQSYFQAVIDYQRAWGNLEKAIGEPLSL